MSCASMMLGAASLPTVLIAALALTSMSSPTRKRTSESAHTSPRSHRSLAGVGAVRST